MQTHRVLPRFVVKGRESPHSAWCGLRPQDFAGASSASPSLRFEDPLLVEEYLKGLPYLVALMPVIREYETMGAERTPENPLGRKWSPPGGGPRRPRGSGSVMLCSGFGRQAARIVPWILRWGLRTRRELCRATDQAHHPPPLRRHDEPLRRPGKRYLHQEALRVAGHSRRGPRRRSRGEDRADRLRPFSLRRRTGQGTGAARRRPLWLQGRGSEGCRGGWRRGSRCVRRLPAYGPFLRDARG